MNSDSLIIEDLDVVILIGGLGKRLRSVQKNTPKCMAIVNGRPFIDFLIDYYISQGIRKFILCVGYLRDSILSHLSKRTDCEISFSIESKQLGTAGAIKNAEKHFRSENHLIINGDSFCDFPLHSLIKYHSNKKSFITMVVTTETNIKDYGSVTFDKKNKLVSFNEKIDSGKGYVNAGIYLFSNDTLNYIPKKKKYSLEKEFFPMIINNNCYAFISESKLIDIGTPERYKFAKDYFAIKENEL